MVDFVIYRSEPSVCYQTLCWLTDLF